MFGVQLTRSASNIADEASRDTGPVTEQSIPIVTVIVNDTLEAQLSR
jgi:hypothetical protein